MIRNKTFSTLLPAFLLAICSLITQQSTGQSKLQSFPLQQVNLLPGVFKDAQLTDKKYMLSLDPDRLLAPYLTEAGLKPKKKNYGNWENTGLDGHIGGHYLSALSFMYAATGDAEINRRLNYMLAELKRAQDKTGSGYLGGTPGGTAMWKDIANGKIEADTFALNKKWVPLYNIHKLFAGLRDAYVIAGKPQAKQILIKLTDYINKVADRLTDQQIQTMLISEQGGLNEVFADVAAITGNDKYLKLARRFSHQELLNPMMQGHDNLNGLHANMQIPKAVGFARIAEVGHDADYGKAAEFFWETVTHNRSVVIGGNSVNEHFNPTGDFRKMITDVAGPETCNSYNMLKLTRHLFEKKGDVKYMDYYERTLYNHILSSQNPTRGGFVYYTSLRPRHYRVYSQPQESMWCCVGSGMENHGKYGELIYSHQQKDLFVNLFIASRLNWQSQGLVLSQHTKFPDAETTQLMVEAVKQGAFTINIRFPGWVKPGKLTVKINGVNVDVTAQPGTYVKLKHIWKKGDKIDVRLPMGLSSEELKDSSHYVAFLNGPIVLAAKTDTTDKLSFTGDTTQFGGYRAKGKTYPLDEAPQIKGDLSNIALYLRPLAGKSQTFTASALITPVKYKNLELIPFYKLHDSRYMIYWHEVNVKGSK